MMPMSCRSRDKDDGQALAAALHPPQRHFQAQVLLQVKGGPDVIADRPGVSRSGW